MKRQKPRGIVTAFARMWTRKAFEEKLNGELLAEPVPILQKPGVYILYRDEHPFYIGKADRTLFSRIHYHAANVRGRYYKFWNCFSAFSVPDKAKRDELEAILIEVMPTVNSARPKQPKEAPLPPNIEKVTTSLSG